MFLYFIYLIIVWSDLGVNLLRYVHSWENWHCVDSHPNAPHQQIPKTSALIEVITLVDALSSAFDKQHLIATLLIRMEVVKL